MTLGQACPPEYQRAQCAFKDSRSSGQTAQDQYIDAGLWAVQKPTQIPEIDFTLHTVEDGTQTVADVASLADLACEEQNKEQMMNCRRRFRRRPQPRRDLHDPMRTQRPYENLFSSSSFGLEVRGDGVWILTRDGLMSAHHWHLVADNEAGPSCQKPIWGGPKQEQVGTGKNPLGGQYLNAAVNDFQPGGFSGTVMSNTYTFIPQAYLQQKPDHPLIVPSAIHARWCWQ
ncbi:hypothetical protein PRZ48_008842 [Zasmidium cellare]|uniref:Uncharacterized protein n=1 Tax=Zasmidium cellare TaxID=395010 RepID=A0ABR0EHP8_ZASCE|nr:hypothetical protein PRZ48_008842 [Zasmidium cellare]